MRRPKSARSATPPRRTAREVVLAEWRRADWAPIERARAMETRSVSAVLPAVLEELGIERKRAEAEVLKVWSHLLDPSLISHAQPVGLRHGTLFVRVDSSVWLEEIVRYRRREILDRLQHAFGPDLIKRISFRLG